MASSIPSLRPGRRAGTLGVILAALALTSLVHQPAAARTTGEELVEQSRRTVERMLADSDLPQLKRYLEKAQGVLIIPELVKGGFILGAEGGSGVLVVRGADGTWSAPAFYTLAAGSIGLQLGAQVAEVVFTVMSERAVEALLKDEVKLSGEISVAVGPIGAGLEAATTTNLNADVYAFSRAAGLFGGGALKGAKLFSRQNLNDQYYGAAAPARAVVVERRFFNPQADALRTALP